MFLSVVLGILYIVCSFGILYLCIVIVHQSLVYAITGVPFVASKTTAAKVLSEEWVLTKDSVVVDLGSGDGSVLLRLARLAPQARFVGYERSPLLVFRARVRAWMRGYRNVSFYTKNFYKVSLEDATHIYMYLFPEIVKKISAAKFMGARPETLVVSSQFPLLDKTPYKTTEAGSKYDRFSMMFYTVGS